MTALIETLRLTTVAQVKRYLRMTPQQVAGATAGVTSIDDALIDDVVRAASDDLANACGRNFAAMRYTETRNGTGTNTLLLQTWPITSMISVSIVSPRTSATADQPTTPLIEGVDFAWDAMGKIQLYCRKFPKGVANVVSVYTAGYDAPPADLAHAAAKWAAVRYREFDRLGMRSKSIGGETSYFDISEFAPDILGIVNNYRARAAIPGAIVAETL